MQECAYTRRGRSLRTGMLLIGIYVALAVAVLVIEAAWWLMAGLALVTLPALYDFLSNTEAGLRLGEDRLDWHSGRSRGSLALREIDHMRFDTRWDFSVRVTAVLGDGSRVRLPYESLPPHRALETAFNARDVPVRRHHFTVF